MNPTLPKDVEERFDNRFNHDSPMGIAVVLIDEYSQRPGQHELKEFIATEIERAKQEEQSIVHAVFWCNWCEKHVPREEVSFGEHTTTGATIFSHKNNHLLEVREFQPNTKEDKPGGVK